MADERQIKKILAELGLNAKCMSSREKFNSTSFNPARFVLARKKYFLSKIKSFNLAKKKVLKSAYLKSIDLANFLS